MATLSVKTIAANCFNKNPPLSVRRDILGVYANDNPQTRSVKERLDLAQNNQFIRIAIVTIQGANPSLQRDLDNANTVWQAECDAWIYCVDSITVNRPDLLVLDQNSCPLGVQNNPTDEEDELFDLGRDLGADLVAYYITNGPGGVGCSAYPAGRRGFWVDNGASPWTFAHELTHVIGLNSHGSAGGDSDNLMFTPTANITNPPPDLTEDQCDDIHGDSGIESC